MRIALSLILWLATAGATIADTCALDANSAPTTSIFFPGVARGPATEQEISSQTAVAISRSRAPMSPKYQNLPRAFVYFTDGGVRHGTIASVLDGVMPEPGEQVVVASRRRDPDLPCAFIPWTVQRGTPAKPTS